MSKKTIIDWENVRGEHLGRVNGLAVYVCRGSMLDNDYIGYEINSDLESTPITKPDSLAMTKARAEKHYEQKMENKSKKMWKGCYD